MFVPPPTVPLHYVINSGSFLWTFSLFIYFRSTSGLSQEANFHFRGPRDRLFSIGGSSGRFAASDVVQISTTRARYIH